MMETLLDGSNNKMNGEKWLISLNGILFRNFKDGNYSYFH